MKHVLVCDDDVHIRRAVEFKLSIAGYEVHSAENGRQAWEHLQRQIPDLLVTDLQMPEINGWELIQRVRENTATAHLPVIMLTAKGLEISSERVEHWGMLKLLTKPFSPRSLLQLIDETLAFVDV